MRYRRLFAVAGPDQPLSYFLLENQLEARAGSMFPTNGAGPDEEVNVYLSHLLTRFLCGDHDPRLQFGAGMLLAPPSKSATTRERADHYRINADHRLLHLGLFGRGDSIRRRGVLAGMSTAQTQTRDLATGRTCYEAAAHLLRRRRGSSGALAEVMGRLATHFDEYVHVLGALATRRLGLGAHISDQQLTRLLPPDTTAATRAVDDLLQSPPPAEALDALLDLWLAHQKNPDPAAASRIRDMADRLGVQLDLD